MRKTAVILATEGLTTNLLYNHLKLHFEEVKVICEQPVSKMKLLKNRVKRVGFIQVAGQVLFMVGIAPLLKLNTKQRQSAILAQYKQQSKPIPTTDLHRIDNINNPELSGLINSFNPDFIIVNGTRIISSEIINLIPQSIFNIHVGITPKYRGVHGGYWALTNLEPELFGTTLHIVDSGIDTGNILGQKTIKIDAKDNFITYPILQYCLGLELVEAYLTSKSPNQNLEFINPLTNDSQLHYHPTFWGYLINRWFRSRTR